MFSVINGGNLGGTADLNSVPVYQIFWYIETEFFFVILGLQRSRAELKNPESRG